MACCRVVCNPSTISWIAQKGVGVGLRIGLLVGVCFFSWCSLVEGSTALASGDTGASKSKVLEVIKQKKFVRDERITDLQIRAEAGSLSRYSGKFSIGYAGPGISNLSDTDIPNPDNRACDYRTNLSGSVGLKYRLTPNDGISISGGMKSYLSGDEEHNWDINDPGVGYDHTYTITPSIQSRTSVHATMVTNSYYRLLGETNGMGIGQTTKWSVPDTKWILGMEVSVSNYLFERGYEKKDKNISDYFINIIPSVEYRLANHLNFNTSFLKKINHYRKTQEWSTFDGNTNVVSQRIGVGWAITREIYFNPYINIFPGNFAWNSTSVAFSTIFSIF